MSSLNQRVWENYTFIKATYSQNFTANKGDREKGGTNVETRGRRCLGRLQLPPSPRQPHCTITYPALPKRSNATAVSLFCIRTFCFGLAATTVNPNTGGAGNG
jgi:hypothetical protein